MRQIRNASFDTKARPIYMCSRNRNLSTIDKIKSSLTFDDAVKETTTSHAAGFSTITTVDSFTYDPMNRLLDHQQSIVGGSTEVLVENNYYPFGLKHEKLSKIFIFMSSQLSNRK